MKSTLFRASTRGHANHGWLNAYHTFSFANYYDPSRIHFGALRVINDDVVAGGEGFGTHPHDNMEIITIPLYGALEHKDSIGHIGVIQSGEVQVMSAGTGVTHSEYNANKDKPVNLFQIWVFPNKKDVKPRYDQKAFDWNADKNTLTSLVTPDGSDGSLWIHQDAWFSMGVFEKGKGFDYKIHKEGNGVFAMVVEGEFTIANEKLYDRDGLGIYDTNTFKLTAETDNARILLLEVPMTL